MEEEGAATSVEKPRGRLSGVMKQVIFALIVASSKLETGMVVSWTAVLPKIQEDNSTSLHITDTDVTWLVSMPGIAGIVATLVAGPITEVLGPARFLQVLLVPAGILWLLQAFIPYLSFFYSTRVLTCVIYIVLGPLSSVLITEMSEPSIRGLLLSTIGVTVAVGQLFMYILAEFLPWQAATAYCAAPILLLAIFTFFVPESPYWLIRKEKKDAALESLKKLRSPSYNVNFELHEISKSIKEQPQTKIKDQIKQLSYPQHYKPVLFMTAVFILKEIGGQYVIFSYTVYMFQKAGAALDAFTCTVLVGVVKLIFAIIVSAILDRVGRRPLMIGSSLVCGLAEAVGAIFLMVDIPGSSWVPLGAVLVYVSAYGIGLGTIPWGLLGELIPTPVRSIGGSICNFSYIITQLIISFLFPYLLEVGLGIAFTVFAAAHAIMTVLLYFYLPETRGRTLKDLETAFKPSQHDK